MPSSERLQVYLPLVNSAAARLRPSDYTDWLPQQVVETPADPTVPAAPELAAAPADQAIDLSLTPPSLNTDGSPCRDFAEFEVFYAYSPGINPQNPGTYVGSFRTSATQHTFPTSNTCYFVAVAWDRYGNKSAASPEVSATPTSQKTVPEVDDYTQNIAQVYVGRGMIAIEFQPPKATWVRWAGWKLYCDVNTGSGWSGTWTLIYQGQEPGFLHKGLNEAHRYKYKLAVLGEGGLETNGTVADNNGQGYQPNASNNDAILARTLFAERMIATTEMISRTFRGGILQSLNWGAAAGTYFDLEAGTLKLGGSANPKFNWDGTNLSLVGQITVTGGSVPYSYVTGGPPANADNTATVIGAGLITTGRIELGSSGYVKAGIDGSGTSDSDIRIWAGATYTNRANAPFRVTQGGALIATSATITGGALGGSGVITIDSSGIDIGSGRIRGGATGYNAGTGFWLGQDAGTYKFFVGTGGGNRITWDGSTLTVVGNITVTGGSVPYSYVTGGPPANADNTATVIGAGLITTGRIELGSGTNIKAGIDGAGTSDSDIRFWAGASYSNRASAPFRVTQGGALIATSATITGT
ncbi:MAG: hypothetical protein N2507_03235, partial [Candidatus Bipolaricaulota bacterium]|nr:hypothetical protein [Candidatus Bipolaricaulota bacterium]